jgi:DoxX-like family
MRVQNMSESTSNAKGALWIGRLISALVVAFMIFDGAMKIVKTQQVIEASVRLGFPESRIIWIGTALLSVLRCT